MAHSQTPLTAAQLADCAANKPLALGNNRLRSASSVKWRSDGDGSAADQSASGTSTGWVYDGHPHLLSAPNGAATTWYLVFDLGSEVTFDSIWIHGTVLPTTLTATVANANTFAGGTNATDIATASVTASAKRWSLLTLDSAATTAQVITARYLRLKMEWAGATIPYIGEVYVGTRTQLGYNPDVPWDPSNYRAHVVDNVTDTGIATRHVLYRGQRHIAADLVAWESTYRTALETFVVTDLQHGTLPFVWIDAPTSAPNAAYFMRLDDPEFAYPWQGPSERRFALVASELGPYFRSLET